ncbi:MAG TPA: oxidoreductase [Actinophytocola sp.]|jgi:NAD(P)-dependent dehydrogenase (short-subunit alcohol dehydrogenase family)|nr:oxidoreductase [Actinophytocola sp.]
MDMELTGRVAVVTGASKGIGLAVVRSLAGAGVRVVAGARKMSTSLVELGDNVLPFDVDLSTPDGPARLVDAAVDEFGVLDILVNNVGAVHPRPGGFLSVTDDDWVTALNINLLAAVRTTRAALPHLMAREASTIVTVCSVNSFLPDPLVIEYGAAKAALANFSKALSKEVGPAGVRVNTVSPGPVATDLWLGEHGVAATVAGASGGTADAVAEHAASDSVTGRFTRPEEVADLVLMLAGGRAGNVTGADFVIDGGLVTTL